MSDLINFFKLDASFDPATASTHEVVQNSNRAKFRQQATIVKNWKRQAELGHGASSTVWLEHDEESKESRAVKQIPKGSPSLPFVCNPKRELLALSQLSKRRDLFVHFYGWYENDQSIFLAMEYFELGDLENFISPKLTENDAKMIGRQLLEGLQVLSGFGLAHRDLKPENIFVARDAPYWWVKIGDFGFSRNISTKRSSKLSLVGTLNYMAPEILLDNGDEEDSSYTLAVDIWSLGCVIFRLLTRQLPFSQNRGLRLYWYSKLTFPTNILIENKVSKDGVSLVSEMMKANPTDRITVATALNHRWTSIQESMQMASCHNSDEKYRKEEPDDKSRVKNAPFRPCTPVSFDNPGSILENHPLVVSANIPSSASNHDPPHQSSGYLQSEDSANQDIQMVEAQSPVLGGKNFDSRSSRKNRAGVYSSPDQRKAAIQLNLNRFQAQRRTLGEEHPDTIHSMSMLARSYYRDHQYREAVQLCQQILEARRRVLGEEHLDTLDSMSNLAKCYRGLCQYKKAMQLDLKGLSARRRILRYIDKQVEAYRRVRRYQEAIQLDRPDLEARRRILGEKQLDTLDSMRNLADSYHGLRWYQKAIRLKEQVLEARRRISGEEDLDTLDSMSNLADSYHGNRQYQDAMELDQDVLEARRRILGEEHPDTHQSMQDLQISYISLGKYSKAQQLGKQILEAQRRISGEGDRNTINLHKRSLN